MSKGLKEQIIEWVADDLEDPIVWTFLWNKTVYDQDETEDMDETYGSIVSKFYLDEIPQFYSVLKG